jgi:alkylation response protein AidB-like acyl-CoA dehydrogenase
MTLISMEATAKARWHDSLTQLSSEFAQRAAQYDQTTTFVSENYTQLKAHEFFSMLIPQELGGSGLSYTDTCNMLRELAHHCASTSLALSMHQHLVAANVWRHKQGQSAEALLRKIAAKQMVLVSTGAGDWLSSNGIMQRTEGGYLVTASKHFASQSSIADLLVTSARYQDPEKGPLVLHFGVPFTAQGLIVKNDWDTLGMRGTGSHTVELKEVFVADSAISLTRPQGEFHPVWNVILTVAMPLIMSVYVGVAEKSVEIAVQHAKKDRHVVYLLGEMQNSLTTAQVLWRDMIRLTNEFNFQPINTQGNEILIRKTLVANACITTVNKAMEVVGGRSFFRKMELERLFRDVQAAPFHPLSEKNQQYFTGYFMQHGSMPFMEVE